MRGRLQLSWRGDLSQLCFLLHVLLHLLVWVMAASIKDLPYLLELLQLFSTSHMIEDTDSYILFMLRRLVYFLKFSKHPLLSWKLLFSSSPDCAQTLYNYIVFSPNTAPLTTLSVPCLPNPSPLPHTHTHHDVSSSFSRRGSWRLMQEIFSSSDLVFISLDHTSIALCTP